MASFKAVTSDFYLGDHLIEAIDVFLAHFDSDIPALAEGVRSGILTDALVRWGKGDVAIMVPSWLADEPDDRTIYVTLCTLFGRKPISPPIVEPSGDEIAKRQANLNTANKDAKPRRASKESARRVAAREEEAKRKRAAAKRAATIAANKAAKAAEEAKRQLTAKKRAAARKKAEAEKARQKKEGTDAAKGMSSSLNPAAAWPFPTGSRPS